MNKQTQATGNDLGRAPKTRASCPAPERGKEIASLCAGATGRIFPQFSTNLERTEHVWTTHSNEST